MKPNCYKCKFKKSIPGDNHISCNHPAFEQALKDPIAELFSILGKRMGPVTVQSPDCLVTGNPHGIMMGWFNHPFNFDPVWLQTCTGYEKEK